MTVSRRNTSSPIGIPELKLVTTQHSHVYHRNLAHIDHGSAGAGYLQASVRVSRKMLLSCKLFGKPAWAVDSILQINLGFVPPQIGGVTGPSIAGYLQAPMRVHLSDPVVLGAVGLPQVHEAPDFSGSKCWAHGPFGNNVHIGYLLSTLPCNPPEGPFSKIIIQAQPGSTDGRCF